MSCTAIGVMATKMRTMKPYFMILQFKGMMLLSAFAENNII